MNAYDDELTERFRDHVWSGQAEMLTVAHDLVCNLACLAQRPALAQAERDRVRRMHRRWAKILNVMAAMVTATQPDGPIACWSCQRVLARRSVRGKLILEAYVPPEQGRPSADSLWQPGMW